MLPNLCALPHGDRERAPDVSDALDVGTELWDLPDALLSEVLAYHETARSLCATVNALSQTSRGFRDMTAWREIAYEYEMPGRPAGDTVDAWRSFVLSWCDKIRVEDPKSSTSKYVRSALESEMWDGTAAGYKWILDHGGRIPSSWIPALAELNVSIAKNIDILKLQLKHFADERYTYGTYRFLKRLQDSSLRTFADGKKETAVQIAAYIYSERISRGHTGDVRRPLGGVIDWERVRSVYVARLGVQLYEDVFKFHDIPGWNEFIRALVPEIEKVTVPNGRAVYVFVLNSLKRGNLSMAAWMQERHPLGTAKLHALRRSLFRFETGTNYDEWDGEPLVVDVAPQALVATWIGGV